MIRVSPRGGHRASNSHRISPPTAYGERLALACGEYVDRFLHLDDVLHTHRPEGPHNHLAFFTVTEEPCRVRRARTVLTTSNARMGHFC
ncbi:hypothetical protein [Micromonospora sp. 4G55]|uniref:hypothetical protein n=1 Tax=Micromonospora sp. 4G55 TaxID=2806102 RepID=UPI001A5AB313|nr:hypothetical protein [Micromonospora sp. 4G55]MBM0255897.1 hypothetical protein [Micromonospora sp. 4G55]